jgi:putative flavoprotein involved in K+ transport
VLGKWELQTSALGAEHVTIAVSGANGGQTVDFRRFAAGGMQVVGRTSGYADGKLSFADDLTRNTQNGDVNHAAVLDEADAYILRHGLDFPEDLSERKKWPDPECLTNPISELDLAEAGITTMIWVRVI